MSTDSSSPGTAGDVDLEAIRRRLADDAQRLQDDLAWAHLSNPKPSYALDVLSRLADAHKDIRALLEASSSMRPESDADVAAIRARMQWAFDARTRFDELTAEYVAWRKSKRSGWGKLQDARDGMVQDYSELFDLLPDVEALLALAERQAERNAARRAHVDEQGRAMDVTALAALALLRSQAEYERQRALHVSFENNQGLAWSAAPYIAALEATVDALAAALELAPLLCEAASEPGADTALAILGKMLKALPLERQEVMEYRHINARLALNAAASTDAGDG